MKKLISLIAVLIFSSSVALAQTDADKPQVTIHTSKGDIRLELYPKESPISVENFLQYAKDGFYEGTIFHRVISHFMIQGGGMTVNMERKATREQITNEADNGLKNLRGTVAMARTNDINSATSQFFINLDDYPVSFRISSNLNSRLHTIHWVWFLFAATNNPPQLGQGSGSGFFQEENSHLG